MMRIPHMAWLAAAAAMAISGCGSASERADGSAVPAPTRIGPHHGPAYALPDNHGYVEIVAEVVPGATDPVIAVYFLGADGSSPATTLPSDAKVVVGGEEHELTARVPTRKDAAGSARLVTKPLPVDPDRVRGEVVATLAGASVRTPFSIGQ